METFKFPEKENRETEKYSHAVAAIDGMFDKLNGADPEMERRINAAAEKTG